MDLSSKTSAISKLSEKELRELVLIPLLHRMGFEAVTLYHGPNERGKDIIAVDRDRLGKSVYLAVVAKASDLNGSVSSSNSLREALHQVEQCFDNKYEDLFGMAKISMDSVWVVTSGRIIPGAQSSIFSTLEKRNLSKLVTFIPCERLVSLIDQHFPSYWDDSLEPADCLREQKNRLSIFLRKVLLAFGAEQTDVDSTISKVTHSSLPPAVLPSPDRSLTRIDAYRVEVDSISSKFAHDFFSDQCGFIKTAHFLAKKALYYAMFEIDEIIDHYEEVISKNDPREFVDLFEKKLSEDYPFWRANHGSAGDAVEKIVYLEDGLNDIEDLIDRLEKAGKLEWATTLVDSVKDTGREIELFLEDVDKEEFELVWQINDHVDSASVSLIHGKSLASPHFFKTVHKKNIEDFHKGKSKTRRITVQEILVSVHLKIREHLEVVLSNAGFPIEQ